MNERLIKPPVQKITSGRIFKPAKKYLYKEWFKTVCVAFTLWLGVIVFYVGLINFLGMVESVEYPDPQGFIDLHWNAVNYWTIICNLVWLIPAMLFTPAYINSMEYSVKSESGETMPEIYVKKGIFTIMTP